jgi:adenosylhomocysteine nucleosidase
VAKVAGWKEVGSLVELSEWGGMNRLDFARDGKIAALLLAAFLWICPALGSAQQTPHFSSVVIVSADAEWKVVKELFPKARYFPLPLGEYFVYDPKTVILHGGWGKISAAASVQYAIDRWNPRNIVNIGTCGGIAGRIDRYAIVVATKTIVYDIVEQMGDADEAIRFYSTDIDLGWAGQPLPGSPLAIVLLSADRDLVASDINGLVAKYGVRAVDWESGAIAWAARRNGKRVLILRGVSDLVSTESGGEAYGNTGKFEDGTQRVMKALVDALPRWLSRLNGPSAPLSSEERPAPVRPNLPRQVP